MQVVNGEVSSLSRWLDIHCCVMLCGGVLSMQAVDHTLRWLRKVSSLCRWLDILGCVILLKGVLCIQIVKHASKYI